MLWFYLTNSLFDEDVDYVYFVSVTSNKNIKININLIIDAIKIRYRREIIYC